MGENPYPTFDEAGRARPVGPPRKRRELGMFGVLLIVVGAFIVLGFAGVKIVDCTNSEEENRDVPCDRTAASRRDDWMTAPNAMRPDRASPYALGLRSSGACSTVITQRQLACDEASARSAARDDPYLREARSQGFLSYVCEGPEGSAEYSFAQLLKGGW